MKSTPSQKKLLIASLFAAVLFFSLAFGIPAINEIRSSDFGKITEKFSEQLQKKQAGAEEIFDAIQKNPKATSQTYDSLSSLKLFDKQGLVFLAYRNDSLIHWTDNRVAAGQAYNLSVFSKKWSVFGPFSCLILNRQYENMKWVALVILRTNYKYTNDYLENSFQKDFSVCSTIEITENPGEYAVKSAKSETLFYLDFSKVSAPETSSVPFLIFFICGFVSIIIFLFFAHKKLAVLNSGKKYFLLFFTLDIVILRMLMFYFHFPSALYNTELFSPKYFATSEILPSLGDLLLNAIVLISFAYAFFRSGSFPAKKNQLGNIPAMLLQFIYLASLYVLFRYFIHLLNAIVIDSAIPFSLENIFSLTELSFLGLGIIAALFTSLGLISFKIMSLAASLKTPAWFKIIAPLIVIALYLLVFKAHFVNIFVLNALYIIYVLLGFRYRLKKQKLSVSEVLVSLLIFSSLTTIYMQQAALFKEGEKRKSVARKLASGEDPVAEYLFSEIKKEIAEDNLMDRYTSTYPSSEQDAAAYIRKKYFSGYWEKYKIQLTFCNSNDSLQLASSMKRTHCRQFFNDLVSGIGKPSTTEDLWVLNYGTGGTSYLAKLDFGHDTLNLPSLFIELNARFIPKGLGYPELLLDKKIFLNTDLSNYSYGRYQRNALADAYGKYYYSINYIPRTRAPGEYVSYEHDGYQHTEYQIDRDNVLVVSRKNLSWLDMIAPFSSIFLIFSAFAIFFTLIFFYRNLKSIRKSGFRERLQLSFIAVILTAFAIIGISSFYYIKQINTRKNADIISEKALSVLIEIQNKISDYDNLTTEDEGYVASLLIKFSNVFFTDINLYDKNGNLIASSRPQIFNEQLLSFKINPLALKEIGLERKTLFLHKEKIGNLEYYSAYVPFFNNKNRFTAIINLPYFAKEGELNRELSAFLVAFINIWVFLIAIAVIISLIVAGRITRPLYVIREKISRLKLGKTNEKIEWKGKDDEIGGLVQEYNRMIDELSLSAQLLASSERESAWREMAMQVAHEIKNPLTPMKLSVQYLEKAWNDKSPDWDERLKRFVKTLVEQIDTLSSIASSFSDFAKMPKPELKVHNIRQIVENSVALFAETQAHEIHIVASEGTYAYVRCDRQQLVRVFNNLIKNSLQSFEKDVEREITIRIEPGTEHHQIHVEDNGCGIPDDMKSKIFTPSFSTKTEGMGMGLAIVRSIVEAHGGSIGFESTEGSGSRFSLKLPAATYSISEMSEDADSETPIN
jgi:two-component system, NtrC family, nitrogen regulation sensor histidine kinase NtrY